jgi:hypothetical protein
MAETGYLPVVITGAIGLLASAATGLLAKLITKRRLKKENATLKAENELLRKFKEDFTGTPLSLKDGVYFDTQGNPYCAACFGSPHDRIPLHIVNNQKSWTLYECPRCRAVYQQGEFPYRRKDWDPLSGSQ